MPTFPSTFPPSSVSPPAIIDPMWEMTVDAGISIRRAKYSRPLRRWELSYLGKTVDELRQIRDFLQQQRLGTLEFTWFHPTAIDRVAVYATTPVTLQWRHGLFTGHWVLVRGSSVTGANEHLWQVTRIDEITVTLQGSVASGISGVGDVILVVPRARAIMQEEGTFPSPAILIGPEQVAFQDATINRRTGFYNFQVTVEELY